MFHYSDFGNETYCDNLKSSVSRGSNVTVSYKKSSLSINETTDIDYQ